jgi:hypothetical protein
MQPLDVGVADFSDFHGAHFRADVKPQDGAIIQLSGRPPFGQMFHLKFGRQGHSRSVPTDQRWSANFGQADKWNLLPERGEDAADQEQA